MHARSTLGEMAVRCHFGFAKTAPLLRRQRSQALAECKGNESRGDRPDSGGGSNLVVLDPDIVHKCLAVALTSVSELGKALFLFLGAFVAVGLRLPWDHTWAPEAAPRRRCRRHNARLCERAELGKPSCTKCRSPPPLPPPPTTDHRHPSPPSPRPRASANGHRHRHHSPHPTPIMHMISGMVQP